MPGEDGPTLHPAIRTEIAAAADGRGPTLYVSMVSGNDHNMLGLLQPPTPFDFVLPDRPDLESTPGTSCLPYDCLTAELTAFARGSLDQIIGLRRAVSAPAIQLESPAPVGDDDFVARYMEPGLRAARPDARIAPRALRYKLWRLHSQIVAETCRAVAVNFIPVPVQSLDAEGFLQADYRATDPTHGNETYAMHVSRQIADIAAQMTINKA